MAESAAHSLALAVGVSSLVTVACRRLRIPALLPLLGAGLALGTSGLGVVDADSLGRGLPAFITVAIGLLIFEGALHLGREELASAPRAVWGLLTLGAAVTWATAALAGHLLLELDWSIAVLLGATLIVTGPTVVQPILRLVPVTPRLHTALAAEAVLIDPLGVVATVATLEVIRLSYTSDAATSVAGAGLWLFAKPLLGGAGVGVVMGLLGSGLLRLVARSGIDPSIINLVAVGVCMTCVGVGELFAPEAGLAAVTICGVIMARARLLGGTELRTFKELLAVLLVGTLFVLLASRFDIRQLGSLSWREAAFVVVLIFLIRPIAVLIATARSRLTGRERVFAATFAPRGIVALSVAAVAASTLAAFAGTLPAEQGSAAERLVAQVARLEPTVFVVIAGTVLLASTFSPLLAWALRLSGGGGSSLIIVGGHSLGRALAAELSKVGIEARIVDSNLGRVVAASQEGIDALRGDATDGRWMDDVGSPHGAGWLIAWTGNHDVDQLAARWATERLGPGHAAIWSHKPVRGPLEPADVAEGEDIAAMLDRHASGVIDLRLTDGTDPPERILGWIRGGRFTLALPDTARPPAEGTTFVGLTMR
jgi:NhaP-type Na+/H+ or K+/H+ antiporter